MIHPFSYTATNAAGATADATVFVRVHEADNKTAKKPEITDTASGFAKPDSIVLPERRTKIIKVQNNDEGGKEDGYTRLHLLMVNRFHQNETVEY